jgi:hypothetical protein
MPAAGIWLQTLDKARCAQMKARIRLWAVGNCCHMFRGAAKNILHYWSGSGIVLQETREEIVNILVKADSA